MIANALQYKKAKADIERFESAIALVDSENPDLSPRIRQAMREGMQSEVEILRRATEAYDALRERRIPSVRIDSIAEVPEALIKARIASGVTQSQLAQRLGLKEQQIQRYEATQYRGASVERLAQVTQALGASFTGQVRMSWADSTVDSTLSTTMLHQTATAPHGSLMLPAVNLSQLAEDMFKPQAEAGLAEEQPEAQPAAKSSGSRRMPVRRTPN